MSWLQNPQWHFQRNSDILIAAPRESFFCSAEAIIQDHTICFFLLTRWQVIKRRVKLCLREQSPTLAVLINILLLACCFWRASAETDCQGHEVSLYWMWESRPVCCERAMGALPFGFSLNFPHVTLSPCTSADGPGMPHPVGSHRPRPPQMVLITDHFKLNDFESWCFRGNQLLLCQQQQGKTHRCTWNFIRVRKLGNPSSVPLSGIISTVWVSQGQLALYAGKWNGMRGECFLVGRPSKRRWDPFSGYTNFMGFMSFRHKATNG